MLDEVQVTKAEKRNAAGLYIDAKNCSNRVMMNSFRHFVGLAADMQPYHVLNPFSILPFAW